jgi:AcrR family transcriptional regulator
MREQLAERLLDHVLRHGFAGKGVRELAKAAGLSDRMLLYYWPTKVQVVSAVLEAAAARIVGMLEQSLANERLPYDRLRSHVVGIAMDAGAWPYMRLWLEVVAAAARGESPYDEAAHTIGNAFLLWIRKQMRDGTRNESLKLLGEIEGLLVLKAVKLI